MQHAESKPKGWKHNTKNMKHGGKEGGGRNGRQIHPSSSILVCFGNKTRLPAYELVSCKETEDVVGGSTRMYDIQRKLRRNP